MPNCVIRDLLSLLIPVVIVVGGFALLSLM
jgi:hypothetical protein